MITPSHIISTGQEIAILWANGTEHYIPMDFLRASSPSAETTGESDLLGRIHGGENPGKDYPGVTVTGWNPLGNYAIQFHFSDGHRTGLYAFDYLYSIGEAWHSEQS